MVDSVDVIFDIIKNNKCFLIFNIGGIGMVIFVVIGVVVMVFVVKGMKCCIKDN